METRLLLRPERALRVPRKTNAMACCDSSDPVDAVSISLPCNITTRRCHVGPVRQARPLRWPSIIKAASGEGKRDLFDAIVVRPERQRARKPAPSRELP